MKTIIKIYVKDGTVIDVRSDKLQKKDIELQISNIDMLESAFEELKISKKMRKIYTKKPKYSLW